MQWKRFICGCDQESKPMHSGQVHKRLFLLHIGWLQVGSVHVCDPCHSFLSQTVIVYNEKPARLKVKLTVLDVCSLHAGQYSSVLSSDHTEALGAYVDQIDLDNLSVWQQSTSHHWISRTVTQGKCWSKGCQHCSIKQYFVQICIVLYTVLYIVLVCEINVQ